jgi:hypothetical protein
MEELITVSEEEDTIGSGGETVDMGNGDPGVVVAGKAAESKSKRRTTVEEEDREDDARSSASVCAIVLTRRGEVLLAAIRLVVLALKNLRGSVISVVVFDTVSMSVNPL